MMEYRITDITDPRVSIYNDLNEKQLKRYYEPAPGLFICESERVIQRALDSGYEMESAFVEYGKAGCLGDLQDIPVYVADRTIMKQITGYELTGGVMAAMRRKEAEAIDDFLSSCKRLVVLEDIENPTNVGAIFRSAAALGAEGVLLTKGSADPLYRRAARVSMGNVFLLRWCFAPAGFMQLLKDYGFYTMALALSGEAVDLDRCCIPSDTGIAIILGNEDHGISDDTLRESDVITRIPMAGGVDSLNVSSAGAVAFWELFHHF